MKRIYFETEEIKKVKKKGYIEIDNEYIQLYKSMFNVSGKLKSITDFQLFLFLAEHCTKMNLFNSNEFLYNQFNKQLKDQFDKEITKMTFYNCLSNLVEAKLAIKLTRGQYQLNPLMVWKDDVKDRESHITSIIESEDSIKYLPNNDLLNY